MEELYKMDWSYTIPDGEKFINNNKLFEESATARILKQTFVNPLSSSEDEQNTTKHKAKKKKLTKGNKAVNKISNHNREDEIDADDDQQGDEPLFGEFSPNKRNMEYKIYIPGLRRFHVHPQLSSLTPVQHDICCRVLQMINRTCYNLPLVEVSKKEMDTYTQLLPQIKAEQTLYNEFVKDQWLKKLCGRHLYMLTGQETFIESFWKARLSYVRKYPQFYQMSSMIPLVYANQENPIQAKILETLESSGNVPDIKMPLLKRRYLLPSKYSVILRSINPEDHSKKKNYVSDDEKCELYAIQNKANIVISSSGLKVLADNVQPFIKTWNIPFVVKEYKTTDSKGRNILHRVAYINQPLPPKNLSVHDKSSWCYSVLLKTNFINKTKKEDVNVSEKIFEYCNDCKMFSKQINNPNAMDTTRTDSDDENLVIAEDPSENTSSKGVTTRGMARKSISVSPDISNKAVKKKKIKDEPNESKPICTCGTNIREKSLKGENVSEVINTIIATMNQNIAPKAVNQETNLTYNLWKIGQTNHDVLSKTAEKDIIVLVRNKVHGCQIDEHGNKQCMTLAPKLEYLVEYGAGTLSSSEAARQWTGLYFSPNSQLLRARIIQHSSEVMMTEKHTLQSVLNNTTWKPQLALGCFFNVFSSLSKLPPGEYLMSHETKHHAFCMIYSCSPSKSENGLDLYEYFNINPSEVSIVNYSVPFIPLDPGVVTPQLAYDRHMPCMFTTDQSNVVRFRTKTVSKQFDHKKKNKNTKKTRKFK